MRTLLITHAYPPDIGAASSRAASLEKHFGPDVKVLAGHTPKAQKNNFERFSVYTRFLFFYSNWLLWNYWTIPKTYDRIVYTSPYSLSFYSWPAIICAKIHADSIILDNVDLWPEIVTEKAQQKWAEKLIWIVTKLSAWAATRVTFTFESLRRRAVEFAVPEAKTEIIPLSISPQLPCESEENDTVVFAGVLSSKYDFAILVSVAKMLPEVGFIVVGEGEQTEYLKSIHLPNFHFVQGFLGSGEYRNLICAASICVCPLVDSKESMTTVPTKVLEWLAMGKKVIATENPDIAETEAYGVKPGDAESMAYLITELIQN